MIRPSTVAVSFLSGKGGVGKTTLALNVARHLSRRRQVWLVDLDLFNRGATSVLWETGTRMPLTVAELIDKFDAEPHQPESSAFRLLKKSLDELHYSDGLHFLPAARAAEGRRAARRLWPTDVQEHIPASQFLDQLCTALWRALPGALIVFDGHGGLDELTIAAAGQSTICYLVNEPDVITFAGTLTLYREIRETYREEMPWVQFILNRIPSRRFSTPALHEIVGVLTTLSPAPEPVALFLPDEPELSGIFGDDPFVSEIYTEFWFAKKVDLLSTEINELTRGQPIEPDDQERRRVRYALKRKLRHRGTVLLILWLAVIGSSLGIWLARLLEILGSDTPTSTWTLYAAAITGVAATTLIILTAQWVRTLLVHRRQFVTRRLRSWRRLRFGDSPAAIAHEEYDSRRKRQRFSMSLIELAIVAIIIGIFVAIGVPSIRTSLQRSTQKRTMADIRTIATAFEAYITDTPPQAWARLPRSGPVELLRPFLEPTYTQSLPTTDTNGHELRYYLHGSPGGAPSLVLVAPGKDGVFQVQDMRLYIQDIQVGDDQVFRDGLFLPFPANRPN